MTTRTRLLILAAPALSAVLVAQQNVPSVRNPLGGDSAVVAEGQSLFNQVCQSCHGPGGQGSDRGPALTRTTSDPRERGRRRVPHDPHRSARHADAPVCRLHGHADLAARQLHSQPAGARSVGGTDARRRQETSRPARGCSLAAPRARPATKSTDAAACSVRSCRTQDDSRRPRCSRRSWTRPRRSPPRAAAGVGGGGAPTVTVVVKMQDGREIRGVRRNEDTFSLQMVDSSGQLQLLDKTKLASVTVDTGSLHAIGLRDAAVGFRDHEPRRIPSGAAGARPDQNCRRAAASGRRHVRAAPERRSASLTTG